MRWRAGPVASRGRLLMVGTAMRWAPLTDAMTDAPLGFYLSAARALIVKPRMS